MYSSFLSFITPTNLRSEHDKFFASNTYHPVFEYAWQHTSPDLTTFPASKRPLVRAVLDQDHAAITSTAKALFETELETQTLRSATAAVAAPLAPLCSGSAEDYARLLQSAFDTFNIDYQIIITPDPGYNARPNHSHRTVYISHDVHYELFSLEGGVRHELVHVLRYLNGQHNQITHTTSSLPSEEGLASYFQDHIPGITDNGLRQHALEYLGSSVGVSGSLRDIYNVMRDGGMSPELSWKRASRHKFGFVNTKGPGDLIKPAMYYYNELKVAQLSSEEKLRLFIGKIAISDLPKHPTYRGLWGESQLVQYFNLT